jgi:hypothetical protein
VKTRRWELVSGGAATALAALALGCGPDTVTLPTPPMQAETAALVMTYQMPTGNLDTSNIDQVRSDAQARLDELHLDWLPDLLSDALAQARTRLEGAGLPTDPSTTPDPREGQLTAVVNVTRICPGWSDPAGPPDATTNGSIVVTAIADTGKLNPEIWGTATSCLARFPPADDTTGALTSAMANVVKATLDGTLIFYSLGPLPQNSSDAELLVIFDGTIGVGDHVGSASFDFELQKNQVKFRVPVASGGEAIVTVGTTLGIEGANGGFSCDLTSVSCHKMD